MGELLESLADELQEFSISADESALIKMQELCFAFSFSASDLVGSWMAFSVTKNINTNPTLECLAQFEREELAKVNKLTKSRKSQNTKKIASYDPDMEYLDNKLGIPPQQHTPDNQKPSTSKSPRVLFSPDSFSPVPTTPSARYASRKASGEAISSFGSGDAVNWCNAMHNPCTITSFDKQTALQSRYTYMFEKLRDYASVLNDMIEDMSSLFVKDDAAEWASIHLPAMEPVPMIGRVCADGSGKLNSQSLLLEGSQETSSGHVLPLDVSQLPKYSLFPGKIIAGLGVNSYGKNIVLKELYEASVLPFAAEPPTFGGFNGCLSVVIAAGPFTTSDSFSYEPLADLMKYLKSNKPHLCILCGPIIDIKHEEVQKNGLLESFEEIFQRLVKVITASLDGTNTKVIFVPSARDAHHDPIYPTPPYDMKQQFQNVYLASDPCVLNVSGVVFGITSTDILLHLGKEEISFPPQSSDRLGRLCSHILHQRNFYPLCPPCEDMCIDYIRFEAHGALPVTPHVMIVPSDLRHFIKDVNGCCFVNPERLTKCSVGGTFARMNINPVDPSSYTGSLINHIQAEIVKI